MPILTGSVKEDLEDLTVLHRNGRVVGFFIPKNCDNEYVRKFVSGEGCDKAA